MPLRFTLRQLEYFVAVGEAGSIAVASEQANVSSPSISASLSQLESEFGVQLFVRKHARGLALTPGGRRFLVEAKKVLAAADGLNDLASDIAASVKGPLNIGCLVTFAQMVLPELRRLFEDKFPDVRIRQVEGHQGDIFNFLRRAKVDIALTYDMEIPSDLHFEPLATLPPYVLLPVGHPLDGRSDVSPEDLVSEPMVLLDLPYSNDYFLSFFSRSGLKPRVVERTKDMAIMRSMVANGFGYSLANVRPRTNLSPDGKPLVFIPLAGEVRPMKLGLLTNRATHKSRTIGAFEDLCRDRIRETAVPGLKMTPR